MEIICEYNDFIIVKVSDKYYRIYHDYCPGSYCDWLVCEVELVERISEDEYTSKGWTDDDLYWLIPAGYDSRVIVAGEELNGTDYLYFVEK